jgi:hypothetical protein
MFYNTTQLTSTDECANLLKQANFEKSDILFRMHAIEQQQVRSQEANFNPEHAIAFVKAQISSHEEHIPKLAAGTERSTAEMALLRLKMRLSTLERRAEDQTEVAQATKDLEIAQLEARATVVDQFIAAINTRVAELQASNNVSRFN